MSIPSLEYFWEECKCEEVARKYIGSKFRAIDEDDFVQECFLSSQNKFHQFDPSRGNAERTLDKQFLNWFYWQMAATKRDMQRGVLKFKRYGYTILELDNISQDEQNAWDENRKIESLIFKLWLNSEFAIDISEAEEMDELLVIVNNVIEMFGKSKQKMLSDQSLVLRTVLQMVEECGKLPTLQEVAERTGMKYHVAARSYEAGIRQIKYQVENYKKTKAAQA